MSASSAMGIVLLAIGLVACGEKPQTVTARKWDTQAYQGAADGYSAPGWKAGDKTAWEAQIRNRAQGQNEYTRTGTR